MRSAVIAFFFASLLLSGTGARRKTSDNPEPVACSIINLIATPERFDGKTIQVVGFLTTGLESEALYLSGEDARITNTQNGVALEIHDGGSMKTHERARVLKSGYVIVEGVFTATKKGHLDLFPGTIERITRLDSYETRPTETSSPTPKPKR